MNQDTEQYKSFKDYVYDGHCPNYDINNDEFYSSKRFSKFVSRIKQALQKIIQQTAYVPTTEIKNNSWSLKTFMERCVKNSCSFEEVKIGLLSQSNQGIDLMFDTLFYYAASNNPQPLVPVYKINSDDETEQKKLNDDINTIAANYIYYNKTIAQDYDSFEEMIDFYLKSACAELILLKCLPTNNLIQSISSLTYADYIWVLRYMVKYLISEIQRLVAAELQLMEGSSSPSLANDEINQLKKQVAEIQAEKKKNEESLSKALKEARNQIGKKDELLKQAQKKTDDALKKAAKDNYNELAQLRKEIKQLKEDNDQLRINYSELADYTSCLENEEDNEDNTFDIESLPESIKNARIIFVCDKNTEHYTLANTIKEVFPNSKFLASMQPDINPKTTDLVIMLTKYICHATFFKVRESCKRAKIPNMYCPYSGINAIARCITQTNVIS